MRKNKNGFTLIEIVIVITIISILSLIAILTLSTTRTSAALKTCQSSRYTILRTYHNYLTIDKNLTLEEILQNSDNQYFSNEVHCPDGGVYSVVNGAVFCSLHGNTFIDVSTSASYNYNFSRMTSEEIKALLDLVIKQSNDKWVVDESEGKIVLRNESTGENRIFFPIELDTYTITSNIKLNGKQGYGIMIESVSDNEANDTGYVFQFDPGYGKGEFVFRERNDGKESSPFARIKPNEVIPGYNADTFWNDLHEVTVDIISYSSTQNQMKVYIDGYEITVDSKIIIDKSEKDAQKYIGFRTWSNSQVLIEDLTVIAN